MEGVVKPTLFDRSGNPVNIPDEQVPEALLSGQVGFRSGTQIPVINPQGEPVLIPADKAREAFAGNYKYDPVFDQEKRIKEEKYGGAEGAIQAGAAGAARGLTFGASDVALTDMGLVEPETLKALQEVQPVASIAGEGLGMVGQNFLLPGGGLIGAASKAGKVAAGALKVADLAQDATTAAKILNAAGQIGAAAAGSAVEGALYTGVASSLTEAALGDADLNGEKILANFGHGALWGGAIGGALKGAEIGIPASLRAAKEGVKKLKDTVFGTGEGDAGLIGKVMPEGKISEAWANRMINLDADQKVDLIRKTTTDLNELNNNVQSSIKKFNTEIRPQELDVLIQSANPTAAQAARRQIVDEVSQAVDLMRKEPELYSQNVARQLELQRDAILRKIEIDSKPVELFTSLREAKQMIQDMAYSKVPTAQEMASKQLLDQVQKSINTNLKNPEIFGAAGEALAQHDEMLSGLYQFIPPVGKKPTDFQKAFMIKEGMGPKARWVFDDKKVERAFKTAETVQGSQKMRLLDDFYETLQKIPDHLEQTYQKVPNQQFDKEILKNIIQKSKFSTDEASKTLLEALGNAKSGLGLADLAAAGISIHNPAIGALLQAYNISQNPIAFINKLAEVERLAAKTTEMIGRGSRAVFDPTIKAMETSKILGTKFLNDDRIQNHQKLAEEIRRVASDPQYAIDKISNSTQAMYDVAPNTTAFTQQAAVRANNFLASKLPGPPHTNPFATPYEPSKTELAKFNRYYHVVQKPTRVLQQVKTNTLTPESLEALTVVYPKLYQQMKDSLLMEATENLRKKKPIPFPVKQSVSQFLGMPLDYALKPTSVLANQTAFATDKSEQAAAMGPVKPTMGGLKEVTVADRTKLGGRWSEK